MSEKSIRFVFFDLDNTILDFSTAETKALRAALMYHGIIPTNGMIERYKEINISRWELLEKGELTREQVLLSRFDMLFEEFDEEADTASVQKMYEKKLSEGHYFMPGALEVLEKLSGKYRLFIVSNGCIDVQNPRLDSAGIRPFFENIFVSEAIGIEKPAKGFFDYCFDRIEGFDKDAAIIVGDSLTSDIQGGINAGIRTCRYNYNGTASSSVRADYEITSLAQLPELLEKI